MSFWYVFKKCPVTVIIHEERANGMSVFVDKATRIKERTGESFYYLKKKRIKLPVQKFSNIYTAGRKNILYLYSKGVDEYQPMKIEQLQDTADPIMRAKDESVKFWQTTAHKDARQRWNKKSTIEKFLPVIMLVVLAIAIVIMLQGFTKAMAEMNLVAGQVTKMVTNVTTTQLEITRILHGVGQTSGVTGAPPY